MIETSREGVTEEDVINNRVEGLKMQWKEVVAQQAVQQEQLGIQEKKIEEAKRGM